MRKMDDNAIQRENVNIENKMIPSFYMCVCFESFYLTYLAKIIIQNVVAFTKKLWARYRIVYEQHTE